MAFSMASVGRYKKYERASAGKNDGQGGSTKRRFAIGLFKPVSHHVTKAIPRKAEQRQQLPNILAPLPQESGSFAGRLSPTSTVSLTQINRSAPPRPARTSSSVIRDVHVWLDTAVIRPSPGIMGGIQYWQEPAIFSSTPSTSNVQYAVPIGNHSQIEFNSAGISSESYRRHQIRLIAYSPKMYVETRSIPLLPSQRHERDTSPSSLRHRSKSLVTPLLCSTAQEPSTADTSEIAAAQVNRGNILRDTRRWGWMKNLWASHENEPELVAEAGVSNEQFPGADESLRAFVSSVIREDSVGNLSEVPTYCSDVPLPSYRTYTTSIRSVSSFGCIDGLRSPDGSQRHSNSRRSGMKRKLKSLANRLHHMKDYRN